MNADWVRELCLSFPHTTEVVQWNDHLVFKVGGKIYAIAALEPSSHWLSFKCSPENFTELIERIGIVPAPYLARAQWVALETKEALPSDELVRLLRESYDLIFAKLPRKTRENFSHAKTSLRKTTCRNAVHKRSK
jgi:predicted DNA-binding protein (MmcQ/YjbR family)